MLHFPLSNQAIGSYYRLTISSVDVSHLIGQFTCGKAAGSDDLCADYFKFAHHKLNVLLSLYFTLFFYTFPYAFIND